MFFSLTWEAIGANTSSMERVCTSEERSIVGRSSGFMSVSSLRLDPPLEYAQAGSGATPARPAPFHLDR